MKIHITPFRVRAMGVVVGSFLLAVTFQNCGKAGFDSALDEGGLASASVDPALEGQFGSRDALKVQNIPFAYDVVPDQIAYSSCFGPGLQSLPGHFTFRIGAYSSGGVKIRQNFFDYLKNNFQPIAPATELSVNQIKTYLAYSPENVNAAPQFAVRTNGLPQLIRTPNSSASSGIDYINVLTNMTNDRMMDPLIANRTSNTLYFPMALSPNQRYLEASISYNISEALASQVRSDVGRNGMLTVTFSPSSPAQPYSARIPASATDTTSGTTDMTRAYGRGYTLQFSQAVSYFSQLLYGTVAPAITNPDNILIGVQEVNLENPSQATGATWSCPLERRYTIVRSADAAISCPKEAPSLMGNASYRAELEVVRRQLKAEDWDVNIALRCVVPKKGSCYPTEYQSGSTTALGIQYNQSLECFQGLDGVQYANPSSPPIKRCAQYVSICTRN